MHQNITINKSNYLIQASYRLTLQEQRLVLACLSKVDSREVDNQKQPVRLKAIRLSAQEYATAFGISLKNAHRELYDAADRLYERSVIVSDPKRTKKVRWIQSQIKTNTGDGEVELLFSDDMAKYISELAGRYTSYLLTSVNCLKSIHSIRLFELLMQWKKVGHLTITVEDLRQYLDLNDKYKMFKAFRSRVISPAVDELNEKSGFAIKLTTMGRGRKVTHLVFEFKEEEQLKMDF